MSEFMETLQRAAQSIRENQSDTTVNDNNRTKSLENGARPLQNQHKATIAALAGVDLFMRFVTRNSHDFSVSVPRTLLDRPYVCDEVKHV